MLVVGSETPFLTAQDRDTRHSRRKTDLVKWSQTNPRAEYIYYIVWSFISRSVSDRSVFLVEASPLENFAGVLSEMESSGASTVFSSFGALFVTACTTTPKMVKAAMMPR